MSKDIFSILEEVIDDRFKIKCDAGKPIIIQEKNNSNTSSLGRYVSIRKSGKIFAFSLDREEKGEFKVFPFFNNSTLNINKKNDAIIFYYNEDTIYVLIVELKSGNPGEYKKQLLAGKNFVDFLMSTINLHYNGGYNIHMQGILFWTGRKSARKITTKRRNEECEIYKGFKYTKKDCNREYHILDFCAY